MEWYHIVIGTVVLAALPWILALVDVVVHAWINMVKEIIWWWSFTWRP